MLRICCPEVLTAPSVVAVFSQKDLNMNRDDITAIIPLGFARDTADGSPAELYEVDGISLLCRALAEVAGSGVTKVLMAVTYSGAVPAWVPSALGACQDKLGAFGLPKLQIEIQYLEGCTRMDAAIGLAMARLKRQWAAVICPLANLPDLTALSLVIEAAESLDRAVIGITQTKWEMAIQLCTLRVTDDHLACGVEYYCPPDDELTVYAGRAVLPTSSRPA
jgi:hypothetical protein